MHKTLQQTLKLSSTHGRSYWGLSICLNLPPTEIARKKSSLAKFLQCFCTKFQLRSKDLYHIFNFLSTDRAQSISFLSNSLCTFKTHTHMPACVQHGIHWSFITHIALIAFIVCNRVVYWAWGRRSWRLERFRGWRGSWNQRGRLTDTTRHCWRRLLLANIQWHRGHGLTLWRWWR